jgi:hypothetical protein
MSNVKAQSSNEAQNLNVKKFLKFSHLATSKNVIPAKAGIHNCSA